MEIRKEIKSWWELELELDLIDNKYRLWTNRKREIHKGCYMKSRNGKEKWMMNVEYYWVSSLEKKRMKICSKPKSLKKLREKIIKLDVHMFI